MRNKKLILVMSVLVLLVGAAAFIAGRMLNQRVGPVGLGLPMGGEDVPISVEVIPAPELPTTRAEVVGLFVERQDNTIIVASISLEAGGGGIVPGSPEDVNSGPEVEVVITS